MHFPRSLISARKDSAQNVNSIFPSASLCSADVKHIRPSDLLMHTLLLFSEPDLNKAEQQTNMLLNPVSLICTKKTPRSSLNLLTPNVRRKTKVLSTPKATQSTWWRMHVFLGCRKDFFPLLPPV